MGTASGFMDYTRQENPWREVNVRLRDYADLHLPLPEEPRKQQASRCMSCGVPFCQSDFGCPLHNLIPEWNDLLCQGQEREALLRLLMTAPFPEFTGRVCPALCEKACNLADQGVTNRDQELYLIETGFARGWIQPRMPKKCSGFRIAVVGSGPAGLAAADLLNQWGHEVTIFEREDRAGGLLQYGIPNMKLPKEVISRRVRLMEAEGITFQLNTGATEETTANFDAVVLCAGARLPRSLNLENQEAEGVCFAIDYLSSATRGLLDGKASEISASGKAVVVVGGGDTGNDCVGTALRQGCKSVVQLEMMPAAPERRAAGNPWPEWPRTLRVDYGQMEAAAVQGSDPRIYETTVQRIIPGVQGKVSSLEIVRLQKASDGRLEPAPGTERVIPCDLLLIAAGFIGCEKQILSDFNLSSDSRGRMMPKDVSHHLRDKLFSAGDGRTGQSLVVRAIADGRAAAQEVHAWLLSALPRACKELKNRT